MPNGKGTISCAYCVSLSVESRSEPREVWRCGRFEADLPPHGSLNPICADFSVRNSSDSHVADQLEELSHLMEHGFLYGYPYPSQNRKADLKRIGPLRREAE